MSVENEHRKASRSYYTIGLLAELQLKMFLLWVVWTSAVILEVHLRVCFTETATFTY